MGTRPVSDNREEQEDDDDKHSRGGTCNFLILSLLSTIAVVDGTYSSAYCDFAKRNVIFSSNYNLERACEAVGLGGFQMDVCETILSNDHSVGFYTWYGMTPHTIVTDNNAIEILSDQKLCMSYNQFIPNYGYVSPSFDAAFSAARVFAILANIFGFAGFYTCLVASCCYMDRHRFIGITCYYFLATICQAFTFLIFTSNVCDISFFHQYFPSLDIGDNVIQDVTCSLDTGSRTAVTATVLYFVCALMAPLSIPPPPLGHEHNFNENHHIPTNNANDTEQGQEQRILQDESSVQ